MKQSSYLVCIMMLALTLWACSQNDEPIPVDEQELSIGAMFGNSSQTADNNDNIVLDSDLSVELDQYLKDLDLPNS